MEDGGPKGVVQGREVFNVVVPALHNRKLAVPVRVRLVPANVAPRRGTVSVEKQLHSPETRN